MCEMMEEEEEEGGLAGGARSLSRGVCISTQRGSLRVAHDLA